MLAHRPRAAGHGAVPARAQPPGPAASRPGSWWPGCPGPWGPEGEARSPGRGGCLLGVRRGEPRSTLLSSQDSGVLPLCVWGETLPGKHLLVQLKPAFTLGARPGSGLGRRPPRCPAGRSRPLASASRLDLVSGRVQRPLQPRTTVREARRLRTPLCAQAPEQPDRGRPTWSLFSAAALCPALCPAGRVLSLSMTPP